MQNLGFRIFENAPQVDDALLDRARALPVANVSDCMNRMDAGGAGIRALDWSAGRRAIVGTALTVRCRPGDNLMLHKALGMVRPGDFIVVDAGGDLTTAILGEIMVSIAQRDGAVGLAIDGAIRDRAEIVAMGFPLFAAGVTHRGPYKDGPGEVNAPIALGGMVVMPGDLVMGDGDGILAVPRADAADVIAKAEDKKRAEDTQMKAIAEGTDDRAWVDRTLEQRGCQIVGKPYSDA